MARGLVHGIACHSGPSPQPAQACKIVLTAVQCCAADILLFNDVAVLYKHVEDLIFIVTGSQDENEVILSAVLGALIESISILLR